MVFSYAVRSVYIESCAMFVRGGVYRVVRTAMGGFMGKLAVAALIFDYILTGPISGVSAGQYIVGLGNELLKLVNLPVTIPPGMGSAVIAVGITLYFWHQNTLGIEESSDKAMKIMGVTTVMIVVMTLWCGVTIWMPSGSVIRDSVCHGRPPSVSRTTTRCMGLTSRSRRTAISPTRS
jgi:amino acid transporter